LSEVRWTRTTVGGPNYLGGSVTPSPSQHASTASSSRSACPCPPLPAPPSLFAAAASSTLLATAAPALFPADAPSLAAPMADLPPSHLGANAAVALTANAAAGLVPPSLAAALTTGLGTAPHLPGRRPLPGRDSHVPRRRPLLPRPPGCRPDPPHGPRPLPGRTHRSPQCTHGWRGSLHRRPRAPPRCLFSDPTPRLPTRVSCPRGTHRD
jgi:hypothetical protein